MFSDKKLNYFSKWRPSDSMILSHLSARFIISRRYHGRLARWRNWRACDVREAKEGLENELWRRWSYGRDGEWAVTWVKRRKGWRKSCGVGEVTESLENELCYDYNYELCSFSNLTVTLPTSQLILQPFRRFTYITAHSPTLTLLHLRHSSFSNPSFASPMSEALHLIHLASRPWTSSRNYSQWAKFIGLLTLNVESDADDLRWSALIFCISLMFLSHE